jgi:hypothetical protein
MFATFESERANADHRSPEPSSSSTGDAWGSWASWGTSVVSTFTSQVTSGISTVRDVVETGLGIPDPEELARSQAEAKKTREANEGWEEARGRESEEERHAGVASGGSKKDNNLFSLFGGALTAGSQILSGWSSVLLQRNRLIMRSFGNIRGLLVPSCMKNKRVKESTEYFKMILVNSRISRTGPIHRSLIRWSIVKRM